MRSKILMLAGHLGVWLGQFWSELIAYRATRDAIKSGAFLPTGLNVPDYHVGEALLEKGAEMVKRHRDVMKVTIRLGKGVFDFKLDIDPMTFRHVVLGSMTVRLLANANHHFGMAGWSDELLAARMKRLLVEANPR